MSGWVEEVVVVEEIEEYYIVLYIVLYFGRIFSIVWQRYVYFQYMQYFLDFFIYYKMKVIQEVIGFNYIMQIKMVINYVIGYLFMFDFLQKLIEL